MIWRQDVPDNAVFAMQDCMRHPDTSPWDWIVAAINAWPGAAERRSWDGSIGRLILPLTDTSLHNLQRTPQEIDNAET